MNSLKNLMIIAVLAAVGYGVYVSLSRNDVDSGQPLSIADGWPSSPKVEMPDASASTSAPLLPSSVGNRPSVAPAVAPLKPYPSSAPLAAVPSPGSGATLGVPMPPGSVSSMTMPNAVSHAQGNPAARPANRSPSSNVVHNLAPPPGVTAASGVMPSEPNPTERLLQNKFADFMKAVQKKLDGDKLAEAHLALSTLHGNPDLPPEQAKQVTQLLDQLAGTVIYSRQHYLEPAYIAKQGETIEQIARQYNVSWELLARINGLMPPGATSDQNDVKNRPLPEGMELKVVRGPFDAVVQLDKRELTLMLQNRYAGRFPIGVGRDQPQLDGEYTVCNKTLNPAYHGPDNVKFASRDPQNPLGTAWIGLTDHIGIHGASDPGSVGRDDNRGTICVGQRELQDLYGILSVGSRVKIVR